MVNPKKKFCSNLLASVSVASFFGLFSLVSFPRGDGGLVLLLLLVVVVIVVEVAYPPLNIHRPSVDQTDERRERRKEKRTRRETRMQRERERKRKDSIVSVDNRIDVRRRGELGGERWIRHVRSQNRTTTPINHHLKIEKQQNAKRWVRQQFGGLGSTSERRNVFVFLLSNSMHIDVYTANERTRECNTLLRVQSINQHWFWFNEQSHYSILFLVKDIKSRTRKKRMRH